MNSTVRQIIFWVVIIGGAFLLYQIFAGKNSVKEKKLSYTDLVQKVDAG